MIYIFYYVVIKITGLLKINGEIWKILGKSVSKDVYIFYKIMFIWEKVGRKLF